MNDIMPILKSLYQRKAPTLLLVLQISITLMILVNTIFMLLQKWDNINTSTGLEEKHTFSFTTNIQGDRSEIANLIKQDIERINQLSAVQVASSVSDIPYTSWGSTTQIGLPPSPEDALLRAGYYEGDYNALEAFGLKLIAGEWFKPSDIFYYEHTSTNTQRMPKLIISKALAEKLYPDDWREALGSTIYSGMDACTVVGIVEKLPSAWNWWKNNWHTVLSSGNYIDSEPIYMVRARPGMREQAMQQVSELLLQTPGRWLDNMATFEQTRSKSHQSDFAVVVTLIVLVAILSTVTAFGIFGQVRYTIITRKKQIGTRRALGASRTQILRYFMLESLIVTSVGIGIGVLLSLICNTYLMVLFELPPIPGDYLIVGALAMLGIGQLATLQPVYQASLVSPAIVTRMG
ncbi:FtsX-like permease family protein [Pseudoalteromonas sp. MMG022]|uniref:ABC transporter permease n=1 Tax=Pseudoalteromonas sp. MMG022 TaxID=2909978 RepID=UPI001F28B2F6|nr:FtsX-like permease family protein [Pseudoalteromonas sp. MMG022]MCF6435671.1 ABC transporter permease [Pseudoalteromonas sp. MMG022]